MSEQRYPRRLIEVDLPIKRISAHARREKSIRRGHISTLHIWWARRPLAACRAVICAALWPDPADPICPHSFRDKTFQILNDMKAKVTKGTVSKETSDAQPAVSRMHFASSNGQYDELRRSLLDFIAEFANWDLSTNQFFLEASRALTHAAHEALGGIPQSRPLVVDPFAGGGSFPLEALRVGADAFASDLNPIPVLLNKVVLEYIPKYGQRLADDVRKWGTWIKEEAEKELAEFYPKAPDGATPIVYLWARTIRCEGPGCGATVPLMRSPLLSSARRIGVRFDPTQTADLVSHTIVSAATGGTIGPVTCKGGAAVCPKCGFTTAVERVRLQLASKRGGSEDAKLIAVVTESSSSSSGRIFRKANDGDIHAIIMASKKMSEIRDSSDIPDEPINHLRGFFNVVLYGMTTWGDLFSPRQMLALLTFWKTLRERLDTELPTATSKEYIGALKTVLACVLARATNTWSSVARWHTKRETVEGTFARHALPMIWDFAEANPFSSSTGNFSGAIEWVSMVCDAIARAHLESGNACGSSATLHPLPDDSVDLLATDPPYYDAVPYADLSDYFYVWHRRNLASVYPTLLSERLTPKIDECVTLAHRGAMYRNKDRHFFERTMLRAMTEARRFSKPSAVGVVVFANKSTAGWEAQLQAMIDAGWIITGSWPIDTEMGSRLRAQSSAALASSIHLVCRPRENTDGSLRSEDIGDWREVLRELPRRIHEWMPRLADEGVVGADAIFACLGPALEIFSRYSRVEKANGDVVMLKEYLEQVWAAVAREALSTVLKDADSNALDPDARLTVIWLWTLGGGQDEAPNNEAEEADYEEEPSAAKTPTGFVLEYDTARKIAQGLGARLEELIHVVEVKGEKARLLPVSERARYLFGKAESLSTSKKPVKKVQMSLFAEIEEAETAKSWDEIGPPRGATTTLDRVHQSMLLFGTGRGEALKRFLVEEGVGRQAAFWKLAQSLSALYPSGSDEKRWVDGVLVRKKGLGFG